nr:MAG TPA: hypothetical protein [Herelleviridae sp.]
MKTTTCEFLDNLYVSKKLAVREKYFGIIE